jgi:hypothetical protein
MLEENDIKIADMKRRYKDSTANFDELVPIMASIDLVDGKKLNDFELES